MINKKQFPTDSFWWNWYFYVYFLKAAPQFLKLRALERINLKYIFIEIIHIQAHFLNFR